MGKIRFMMMGMSAKTPQFDRAIEDYFANLQLDERGGQWRMCRFSGEKFYVRPEDIVFYKKLKVPLPTLSPHERWRRKLAYCNSYNLFKVSSAYSGKPTVAAYPSGTPYKIYEHQAWYGDTWNPFDYGKLYDLTKEFFPQFAALQKEVPRPNLYTDTSNVNSDYVNTSVRLKNCFLAFDSMEGENLYYFTCCLNNRDCVDCDTMFESEACYECLRGIKLYKCFFCISCEACIESYFLSDCKNCSYCFGGTNLRNRKYVFFNEQLTKEEYEKKVKSINLKDYDIFLAYQEKFKAFQEKEVHPALHLKNVKNCVGEFVDDSRDCYFVYYLLNSENCAYCFGALGLKDCMDVIGGTNAEACYEVLTISTEHLFEVKFSTVINESKNLEYCDLMRSCHNCFGCVGLNNKSFCILNKQYEEGAYWRRVDDIKMQMLAQGEYGEFFPPQFSPFPYKITYANSFRGFKDVSNALQYGYHNETIPPGTDYEGDIIDSEKLPRDIKDADDSILKKIILDKTTGKKFRIMPFELSFYRRYNLPLPRNHPNVRREKKLNYWNVKLEFHERVCPKCGVIMQTQFHPEERKTVYCIDCYRREVA